MAIEVTLTRCHLRDLRNDAGYTQSQLAKIAGINRVKSIGYYENGIIDMHLTTALKFCAIFNCSLSDLFDYEIKRK